MYKFKPTDLVLGYVAWCNLCKSVVHDLAPEDVQWLRRWEEWDMMAEQKDIVRVNRRYAHYMGYQDGLRDALQKST